MEIIEAFPGLNNLPIAILIISKYLNSKLSQFQLNRLVMPKIIKTILSIMNTVKKTLILLKVLLITARHVAQRTKRKNNLLHRSSYTITRVSALEPQEITSKI